MTGQTNLQEVLSTLQISCDDFEYGLANVQSDIDLDYQKVLGTFYESEGLTVIAVKAYLDGKGLTYEGPYAKLTIDIHTSLELVGLTAVLATKLAEAGISANVVAAFYHDHVFVQYDLRNQAIDALNSLKS